MLAVSAAEAPATQDGGNPQSAIRNPQSEDESAKPLPKRSDGDESRFVGTGRRRDDGGGWLQTVGALAAVAVLIFAARWFLRRWSPAGSAGAAGPMEVVARASVAPRQQLLLVRLGGKLVLIGTGGGAMTTLAEVTDPAEVEKLIADAKAAGGKGLAGLFGKYAKGDGKKS